MPRGWQGRKAVMEAVIFNIQRMSMHDGPGVRSTVFFKGVTCGAGGATIPSQSVRCRKWSGIRKGALAAVTAFLCAGQRPGIWRVAESSTTESGAMAAASVQESVSRKRSAWRDREWR